MSERNAFATRRRHDRAFNALSFCLLLVLTFLVVFPIWWILRSSLMTNGELYAYPPSFFPPAWRFENYSLTMTEFPFWTYLKNTFTIIVPSVFGATVTATVTGWGRASLAAPAATLFATGTVSGTASSALSAPMASLIGYSGAVCSVTAGKRSMRFLAAVPWRNITAMPRARRSRASSRVVHSWSEEMPAAI